MSKKKRHIVAILYILFLMLSPFFIAFLLAPLKVYFGKYSVIVSVGIYMLFLIIVAKVFGYWVEKKLGIEEGDSGSI